MRTRLSELIERHKHFWSLSSDRPLITKLPTRVFHPKPYPLKDGKEARDVLRIEPDDIDPDKFFAPSLLNKEIIDGDLIVPISVIYPQAWMEALIGCPIYVSAYGCVAKPLPGDLAESLQRFSIDAALQSPWAQLMEHVVRQAVRRSGQVRPVRQLHQRGVVDMLAAYLGEENLCTTVFDFPEEVAALAQKFTDLFITVARRQMALRGRWHDGFVSTHMVYAPGALVDYQIDASSLFSCRMYQRFFLKFDRRIFKAFPYSTIHLHACGLQHLPSLLAVKELRAIQIQLDRETGNWDQDSILHACRTVQEHDKALIISGQLSDAELSEFTSALLPNGLVIHYWNP